MDSTQTIILLTTICNLALGLFSAIHHCGLRSSCCRCFQFETSLDGKDTPAEYAAIPSLGK